MSKELTQSEAVAAIVNGCIGVAILLMPTNTVQVGWLPTVLIVPLVGAISLFSCWLQLRHCKHHSDYDSAIQEHFDGARWVKVFYDMCLWSSLFVCSLFYFNFVVVLWEVLAPDNLANPILNAAVYIALCVFLKYKQLGAHLLAYGLISIGAYLLFVTWAGATAPAGQGKFPLIGDGTTSTAALFQSALAIQNFFIPVLKGHSNSRNHFKIVFMALLVLCLSYFFAGFVGGYGNVLLT